VKTVYAIAMEGDAVTGCDWYDTPEAREAAAGRTGAEYEVHFEMEVGSDDECGITEEVDEACWDCVWRDGRGFKVVLPCQGAAVNDDMNYWFKPWTHWHQITPEARDVLLRAGFQPDRLCGSVERPEPDSGTALKTEEQQ
jgi:hypothetical protein